MNENSYKYTNRLLREKSPYLLQHAHNPVDWYPWGEEAFAKARKENKPIFLSVGYSTCHWCHVMARESFENEEVAEILNKNFVPIKVDREERPDIDKVYMTYVQAITGGGGWPMSVWLTPELKPFVGGTYYPPEDKWGMPGFKTVLKRIAEAWKNDHKRIVDSSNAALEKLRQIALGSSTEVVELERDLLDKAYNNIKSYYDPLYGGFSGAPKFPQPSVPDFMLRYYARTGNKDALNMTLFTLRKMAEGGIHDHIGGGFHRYSVDERWHVPHFEKMLYDQAQLARTYLDAYQITKDPFYADIARDILDYVRRDMTGPNGELYSAEDADSDIPGSPGKHAEGAFYAWEMNEISKLLTDKESKLFSFYYGIKENGNVNNDPHGEFRNKNILFVAHSLNETAKQFSSTKDDADTILKIARKKLFEARSARPRPHRDDKSITAWNGLMISAFARGYQVLRDESYLHAAESAAEFIWENLYDKKTNKLLRRHRAGESAIHGYADDYAFLIQALIDIYESSFNVKYFSWAVALQDKQNELFWDESSGGYFSTTGTDKTVLLRIKNDYDSAEPSPNSVSLMNLLRLSQMTDNKEYSRKADKTLVAFSRNLNTVPHYMPQMMAAFNYYLDKPKQIIIAGKIEAADTMAVLKTIHENFIPNKILMLADGAEGQRTLAKHFKFISSINQIGGKATAYICENNVCKLPTNDLKTIKQQLENKQITTLKKGDENEAENKN